jgi:hypothetical protein
MTMGILAKQAEDFFWQLLILAMLLSRGIVGVHNNREQGKPLKRNNQQYTAGYAANKKLRTAKLKAN